MMEHDQLRLQSVRNPVCRIAIASTECPICLDDRQFIAWDGQEWISSGSLRLTHRLVLREESAGLYRIGVEPKFAIGQRALLVRSGGGNILWDCVSLVDGPVVEEVTALGGLSAIAISHPHYYSSMLDWSRAFGGVPIYLHASDRQWVMRDGPEIVFWEGETKSIGPGLTLIRCGGHFAGGTVLHWADGVGALLTGDIVQVVPDRRYVSFMYSYPNYIPLNAVQVTRIAAALEPYPFERIFGAWWRQNVATDAKATVRKSVARYLRAIDPGSSPASMAGRGRPARSWGTAVLVIPGIPDRERRSL